MACVYWTLQTIITIGYGDLNPFTTAERMYACFTMFVGVFFYSFTVSSLTSVLSGLDNRFSKINERMEILNKIKKEFPLDLNLMSRLKNAIKYGSM